MTSNDPERKSIPAVNTARRMAAFVLLCAEEMDQKLVLGNLPVSANDAARHGVLTLITTQDDTSSISSVPVPLVVVAPLGHAQSLRLNLQMNRRVRALDAEDDPDLLYQIRDEGPVVLTSRPARIVPCWSQLSPSPPHCPRQTSTPFSTPMASIPASCSCSHAGPQWPIPSGVVDEPC